MDGFRSSPPERMGEWEVEGVSDYLRGERMSRGGKKERLHLPSSNVLAYTLAPEGRVTLRPSGTEPKIKYYFELKEEVSPSEPLEAAHRRAQGRLSALEAAFLQLAKERGQQVT
jgi:phosphomannomutase